MKSQHFSLISPGRGHCDLTKRHQNDAENVFRALWLQNIWFCVFSQFSIKFHFGRMKRFARRLSDFLSLLPVPEATAASLASRSIWQLYARSFAKSALSPLLSALWALMLQEHQSMIISLIVCISAKRRMTFLSAFLLTCRTFFLSQSAASTAAGKARRPDQCPAGLLARARVLIKVFCR